MNEAALFSVTRPPASLEDLTGLCRACGDLPAAYLDFLAQSNGAEAGIHDRDGDCLVLWTAREVPELNQAYQIARWLPEFLAIGSDGGDDAIGFDRAESGEAADWPVVRIGFGNLDRADFVRQAPSFHDWRQAEFRLIR